jgi:uncharacterized protein YggL (DUF469 family)
LAPPHHQASEFQFLIFFVGVFWTENNKDKVSKFMKTLLTSNYFWFAGLFQRKLLEECALNMEEFEQLQHLADAARIKKLADR